MTGETKDDSGLGGSSGLTKPPQIDLYQGPISRIPRFWRTNPALWFATIEAVFSTSKITSSTIKFQLLLPNIDQDVLTQIQDLVVDPAKQDYEALKTRLLQTYGESENLRIKKLLEDMPLGDQTPSQLLRRMQQLAGSSVNTDFIRTLWLKNLPSRFQPILAATDHTDVEKLAAIADKIHEVSDPPDAYVVNQTTSSTSTSRPKSSCDSCADALRQLRLDVDKILGILDYRQRGRSRSRGPPPHGRYRSKSRNGLCYYHDRFKEKSHKCVKPCKWVNKTKEENLNTDQ